MGKMAAYLGPPAPVASLLERGGRSLITQAGECPDGFGVAWYPGDADPEPVALTSALPLRREDRLLRVARRVRSRSMLAWVRRVGPGDPLELGSARPLQYGPFLFHHEGEFSRFREVFDRPLRSRLKDHAYGLLEGSTCAELLFATWVDALGAGRSPDAIAGALEAMVTVVQEIALRAQAAATFAVVVSDGSNLVTLRTATAGDAPAMYTTVAEEGAPLPATSRVIATEPLFEGSWSALDPHSLVIFTTD